MAAPSVRGYHGNGSWSTTPSTNDRLWVVTVPYDRAQQPAFPIVVSPTTPSGWTFVRSLSGNYVNLYTKLANGTNDNPASTAWGTNLVATGIATVGESYEIGPSASGWANYRYGDYVNASIPAVSPALSQSALLHVVAVASEIAYTTGYWYAGIPTPATFTQRAAGGLQWDPYGGAVTSWALFTKTIATASPAATVGTSSLAQSAYNSEFEAMGQIFLSDTSGGGGGGAVSKGWWITKPG